MRLCIAFEQVVFNCLQKVSLRFKKKTEKSLLLSRSVVQTNTYPSRREYFRYNLYDRKDETILLSSRRLLQQFIIDYFVRIENDITQYAYKLNNDRVKAQQLYENIRDNVVDIGIDENDGDDEIFNPDIEEETATRILKSLTGGPKWYKFKEQNALAVQRHFGKPDLFITFTCNPKWPEIVESLPSGVPSIDRPDIVCRVFCLKLKILINMLRKGLFGVEEYLFYSVEVQKRGLPHAHILIKIKDFVQTTESIDKIISAEIPDKKEDKELFDLVVSHMMHCDCKSLKNRAPCWHLMKNKCSKDFPKPYCNETRFDPLTGKITYKRIEKSIKLDNGKIISSGNVVPYNVFLLKFFNVHINIEIVNHVLAVSYLF
uniref:Helitron_like_N domain-containing protein n=1 Tax=Parastrongyloides trichosuri TaxID=131310 RepID=A0A0N4Z359_PARTI